MYFDEIVYYVVGEIVLLIDWVCVVYGNQLYWYFGVNFDDELVVVFDEFKIFLFDYGFLEVDFDVVDWIDLCLFVDVLQFLL